MNGHEELQKLLIKAGLVDNSEEDVDMSSSSPVPPELRDDLPDPDLCLSTIDSIDSSESFETAKTATSGRGSGDADSTSAPPIPPAKVTLSTKLSSTAYYVGGAATRASIGQFDSRNMSNGQQVLNVITNVLTASGIEEAKAAGMPVEVINERCKPGCTMVFPSVPVHNALERLEHEVLVPICTSVKHLTALREKFYQYVYHKSFGHRVYDDIHELIFTALIEDKILSDDKELSHEFLSAVASNVTTKLIDFYLRTAVKQSVANYATYIVGLDGPNGRLSFRLQVMTERVRLG